LTLSSSSSGDSRLTRFAAGGAEALALLVVRREEVEGSGLFELMKARRSDWRFAGDIWRGERVAESARGRRELSRRNSVRVVRREKENKEVWIEADRRDLSIDGSGRAESLHSADKDVDQAIQIQRQTIPAKRQLLPIIFSFPSLFFRLLATSRSQSDKEGLHIIEGGRRDCTSSGRTEVVKRLGGRKEESKKRCRESGAREGGRLWRLIL
jgi:hypothetical protein